MCVLQVLLHMSLRVAYHVATIMVCFTIRGDTTLRTPTKITLRYTSDCIRSNLAGVVSHTSHFPPLKTSLTLYTSTLLHSSHAIPSKRCDSSPPILPPVHPSTIVVHLLYLLPPPPPLPPGVKAFIHHHSQRDKDMMHQE